MSIKIIIATQKDDHNELVRILRTLADNIEATGKTEHVVKDRSGNQVGWATRLEDL